MLHHDNRIARIAQRFERVDELHVVPLVQSDARLVENVQNIDQFRTYLRGEPYALALAAGKRARGSSQRKIAQSHVEQESDPFADFLDYLGCDFQLLAVQLIFYSRHPPREVVEAHRREVGYVFVSYLEMECLTVQPAAVADAALLAHEELLPPFVALAALVLAP